MVDYKCEASYDNICNDSYCYGVKCDGYKKECSFRQIYAKSSKYYRKLENTIRGEVND